MSGLKNEKVQVACATALAGAVVGYLIGNYRKSAPTSSSKDDYYNQVQEAAAYIKRVVGEERISKCKIGLVLGSGLGDFADDLEDPVIISYNDIPHYPKSTVIGHKGNLVIGHYQGTYVVTMQGRKHYYESCNMKLVTFPIRVFKALGCEALFCTNATGGINKSYDLGDFMLIKDHINMMGNNPCLGPNDERFGTRFHDMSRAYNPEFRTIVKKVAKENNIKLQEGVFLAVTGPSYETPAEIECFRTMGADNVGMSTVPEVIVGTHSGLKCVAISCITNMAAGVIQGATLNHAEVTEIANKKKPAFKKLLGLSIAQLSASM